MNTPSTHGDEVRNRIIEYLKGKVSCISPVSYQDICDDLGISSTSVVSFHLKKLEKQGRIKTRGRFRGIEVIEDENKS